MDEEDASKRLIDTAKKLPIILNTLQRNRNKKIKWLNDIHGKIVAGSFKKNDTTAKRFLRRLEAQKRYTDRLSSGLKIIKEDLKKIRKKSNPQEQAYVDRLVVALDHAGFYFGLQYRLMRKQRESMRRLYDHVETYFFRSYPLIKNVDDILDALNTQEEQLLQLKTVLHADMQQVNKVRSYLTTIRKGEQLKRGRVVGSAAIFLLPAGSVLSTFFAAIITGYMGTVKKEIDKLKAEIEAVPQAR